MPGRTGLFRRSRLTATEREALLDIHLAACLWTRIYFGWRPNLPDEGDNHLIELAVAGGAGHIAASNVADLSRMNLKFPSIRAISAARFLKETDR